MSIYKKLLFYFLSNSDLNGVLTVVDGKNNYKFGRSGQESGGFDVEIRVISDKFYRQVIVNGDIGLGEAYFLHYFDSPDLKKLFVWFLENRENLPSFSVKKFSYFLFEWAGLFLRFSHLKNKNTKLGSKKNIKEHYDVSNDFYKLWLDKSITYSSAIFAGSDDLYEAQQNKYQKICEQLELKNGEKVLEIGSGWGGFAKYVTQNFDIKLKTITISDEQFSYCKKMFKNDGIDNKIELELLDYRELEGEYDKIVSIEMMEALGHKYVPLFINKCHDLLKANGKMCYQCITYPDVHFDTYIKNNNYIKKYIFPGGELLSMGMIKNEVAKYSKLKITDIKSIGLDYAKTLNLWKKNYIASKRDIFALGFDELFYRKWYYYLVYCEAGFETSLLDDFQITIKKYENENNSQ